MRHAKSTTESKTLDAVEDNYTATAQDGVAGITYTDILDNDISESAEHEEIIISQDKKIVVQIHTKISLEESKTIKSKLFKYLNLEKRM